ncbi:unnamed protein product, partial [Didymodactylos carnosus]
GLKFLTLILDSIDHIHGQHLEHLLQTFQFLELFQYGITYYYKPPNIEALRLSFQTAFWLKQNWSIVFDNDDWCKFRIYTFPYHGKSFFIYLNFHAALHYNKNNEGKMSVRTETLERKGAPYRS